MKRARKGVAAHSNNGSRGYLAEEVKELREKVDRLNDKVITDSVSLATLLEAEQRANKYREVMQREMSAARAEQQQVQMSVTSVQASVEKIAKTIAEHETERQQRVGALALAKASARVGWGIIGGIVLAIAGGIIAVFKYLPFIPKSPPGSP